ncbi:MAG TPA: hypothetical protein VGA70_00475 [Longimicrobiales bacterium]|jgi:hypothetical protein
MSLSHRPGSRALCFSARATLVALALALAAGPQPVHSQILFQDDFERDLEGWTFPHGRGADLIDSGDPAHGQVLSLQTRNLPVLALMRGSEVWEDVRVEGWLLFPESVHNYLGFMYRYVEGDGRSDFGNIYVKGNGSYIRVNPHRDTNVGRTLYEEMFTRLEGPGRIDIGRWTPFAMEVVGAEAHLYVGEVNEPQVTVPFYPYERGAFGFKPRNPGGAVWLDDIRVRAIDGFTYRGPPRPDVPYHPEELVTDWRVLGPLTRMVQEVETRPFDPGLALEDGGRTVTWRPWATDPRGAVVTGLVTDYRGPRKVAYFLAEVTSPQGGQATAAFSTVDDLAVWINGQFWGFPLGDDAAWWDVGTNPDHPDITAQMSLRPGVNHILIRVVGGSYATGGFFMRIDPRPAGT